MPQSLLYVLLGAVLLAAGIAELLSLAQSAKRVHVRCEVDMKLTEPDEVATLRFQIQNNSRLPMPFVSFCFDFSEAVELREDEAWIRAHRVGGPYSRSYSFYTPLLPHRGRRGQLRFSLKTRGLHELGKVYLETGDFLGLRSTVRTVALNSRVVCTARALADDPALKPLGGFLGDFSVRRFILEDPSLILGYREYTGSEPMKAVSWLQTARTGRLTVKQHDFTVDADVAVLLDVEQCAKDTAERCLSLVRTVCDALEARQIPYSVRSNGDLFDTEQGVGRKHCFEVQRRIGLARFVRYQPFPTLLARRAQPGFSRLGCIVVAPRRTPELGAELARLEAASGVRVCLLTGEEAKNHA